jgi:SSS family solute:Na+ symporter
VNPRTTALAVICAIVGIGSLIGFLARFHRKMDLEQWTVAGKGFGLVLVWLLMAGEIFTTFTFFGASGWAYSQGAPVLYILGYSPLIYAVSFYILPPIWEVGRRHKLQTQADFFHALYGNRWLAAFVALIGVISLVPYCKSRSRGWELLLKPPASVRLPVRRQ